MKHTAQFGSQIAKNGFNNEKDVINKFNNWLNDLDSQDWITKMGYDLAKIHSVKAVDGITAKRQLFE